MTALPPTADPVAAGSVVLTRRGFTNTWLFTGLVVSAMATGFAVVLLVVGSTSGITSAALGIVFAAIPLGIVVPAFLWLDRFEPEPKKLLLFTFGWGACLATVVSLVVNTATEVLLIKAGSSSQLAAVISAPIVEESTKGLVVLLIFLVRRKDFNGIVDGVVLAGISAAGFAATENILYLAQGDAALGAGGLIVTFVLRGLILPFSHPMFTVCTGVGIGIAAVTGRKWLRVLAPICGWLVAMALHAFWNWTTITSAVVFTFPLVEIPLFCVAVIAIVLLRRREGQMIGRYLWDYVERGWFSPGEVWMLASMPRRKQARRWARNTGGNTAVAAMRAFQNASSDLALLRARVVRGSGGPDARTDQWSMLANVTAARTVFCAATQPGQGPPGYRQPPPGYDPQQQRSPQQYGYRQAPPAYDPHQPYGQTPLPPPGQQPGPRQPGPR